MRRALRFIRGLSVIGVISLALAGPVLTRFDALYPADAIVVIGGDHKPERVKLAVDLYQAGYAPVVIISAGNEVREGAERLPEAEVMRRQAVTFGLPETAILIEAYSLSTFQNAYYTQRITTQRGFKSILLVASLFHSRRAGRIFAEVYEPDFPISVQTPPPTACALCWGFQPDQIKVVLYEYYNWGRYVLGFRLPNEARPADTISIRH